MNVFGFSKEQQLNVQQKKCLDLKARLEKGWNLTDGLPDDHRDVKFWIKLLRTYEKECFTLATMGGREL